MTVEHKPIPRLPKLLGKHSYPGRSKAVQARRDYVRKIRESPCVDCGGKFPWYVMELDHVKGEKSDKTFTALVGRSWKSLLAELDKCEIVCANCHNIRSYRRGQWG